MREVLYTFINAVFSHMGPVGVQRFGRVLGWFFWHGLPARRKLAVSTAQKRLGISRNQAEKMIRTNFRNTAQAFGEIFLTRKVDHRFFRDHVRISDADQERLSRILEQNRPVVAATGHLGSWELLAGLLRLLGPGRQCQVVVRFPRDKILGQLMLRLRSAGHIQILPHRHAVKGVLSCLKHNGITAFLVDHNCSRAEAEFLSFLGKTAAVNKGPAVLALRSNALVLPVFLLREEGGWYRLKLGETLNASTRDGTQEEKIRAIADFYTRAVEQMVLKHPEQWFWMHKRWKTRPK